jgi:hypothetical protein
MRGNNTGVRFGLLCLLAGLTCALILGVWPREREPVYHKKALSEWLLYNNSDLSQSTALNPERKALQVIGSNAFPWLVKWVRYERPAWRRKIEYFGRKIGIDLQDKKRARADAAWHALTVLAREGEPALSLLINLSTNPPSRQLPWKAMHMLTDVGPNAIPGLTSVATNQHLGVSFRGEALSCLGTMSDLGTNSTLVITTLLVYSSGQNNILILRLNAHNALVKMILNGRLDVIALSKCLQEGNHDIRFWATVALKDSSHDIQAAIPFLVQALSDPSFRVREGASNTLRKVTPVILTE